MESTITTPESEAIPKQGKSRTPRSLREIIISQILLLNSYIAPVLETDDAEAIHKMRVTTRRLQASVDLLQTRKDEFKVRRIKKELRNLRRQLSLVRNYDVFLLLIEKETSSRSTDRRQAFQHLKAVLEKCRAEGLKKARGYLKHFRLAGICSKLGLSIDLAATSTVTAETELPAEANPTSEASPSNAATPPGPDIWDKRAIELRAAERIEQRLGEFLALVAQSHPTTDPAELHQLRIAAKRLRYLLEIVTEMGYGDATRALSWLRRLQDRIGDWHDLVAIEEEIILIVSSRKFLREHIRESSRMLQAASHLQSRKQSLVTKLFPIKVPQSVPITSRRFVRALRRGGPIRKPKAELTT